MLQNYQMADAVKIVLENLSSLIQKELGLFLGVHDEMKRLSSILTTIQAVLEDADEKQLRNGPIKIWLQEVKDAAHLKDDILSECAMEATRLEYQGMHFGIANKGKRPFLSTFSPKHVLFRYKISKKMKNISESLDEIAERRNKYHLRETGLTDRGAKDMGWRQTTSIITDPQVIGREEEREKIVDYLVSQASNFEDLSVYPIVGMGGLGKTTLAQYIFNDERVIGHFELRIWVCVSNEFDLNKILKTIKNQHLGMHVKIWVWRHYKKEFKGWLKEKRYLFVLDDVWNDEPDKWDKLKYIVTCGSKGASIIVTTRLAKVASIMGTIPPHQLPVLSGDGCWELFKYRAFGPDKGEPEELVAIGKEIVKKCGGVPLVAKALGSLLRFKSEKKEWLSVKESKLWSLPQEENFVMPILRLSYLNLPIKLRQCFAFCAIFPKDHEISKHLLIELWMANGFISSKGTLEVEDIGDEVWNELCWRSFFQDIKTDEFGKTSFKMHDLVHDLAQSVGEEVCCINDINGLTNLSKRTRHLSIYTCKSSNQRDLLHLSQVKSLKTCMVRVSHGIYLPFLLKCYSLRVLQFKHLKELSSSIGYLKYLRYLNLSRSSFNILPESICSLWNLQILNLNYCNNLESLPRKFMRLRALRHLHLRCCHSLSTLPSGMGQLAFLKTLNVYIVGKKKGLLLAELEHLNLRGGLHIKHLENVRSVTDANNANMVNKNLDDLQLSWGAYRESESRENAEPILEALEPHAELKALVVEGYGGVHFPRWLGSATLKYLSQVELSSCVNCLQLPTLGKLPSLKRLRICNMNHLRYLDSESYTGEAPTGFQALEYLSLVQLPKLERLSKEDGQNIFLRLSEMLIIECPKFVLPCLPSLRKLKVYHKYGEGLVGSIHNPHCLEFLCFVPDGQLASFPDDVLQDLIYGYEKLKVDKSGTANALEKLSIRRCNSYELIIEQMWRSLKVLEIRESRKLRLSGDFRYLSSLEHFTLIRCPEVDDLPSEAMQHLTALKSLHLYELPNLPSLPDCFGNLSDLRSILIYHCPNLMSLPTSIQGLRNLEKLIIVKCPELTKRCEKETGED